MAWLSPSLTSLAVTGTLAAGVPCLKKLQMLQLYSGKLSLLQQLARTLSPHGSRNASKQLKPTLDD